MDTSSYGFPFRWFLPVIQLLICIVILQPYWSTMRAQVWRSLYGFEQSLLGSDQSRPQPQIVLNVTPDSTQREPVDIRLTTPAALNLPMGFLQLPYVLTTPGQTEWAPDGMLLAEWRALSWPFLGLVFWWAAGRGLEAFFAAAKRGRFALIRPPLRPIEVTAGVVLFLLGSAAGVMFALDRNPFDLMTDWVFAAGAGLWAVLGAVVVVARLLQWRVRRLARVQGIAYTP